MNDIKHSKQQVKEWLKTVLQSVRSKSAMMTSPPKPNLPVFDGDPCAWAKYHETGRSFSLMLRKRNVCLSFLLKHRFASKMRGRQVVVVIVGKATYLLSVNDDQIV